MDKSYLPLDLVNPITLCKHLQQLNGVMMSPDNQKKALKDAVEILIQYLNHKVDERDWHAVSDAANDLKVLEARIVQIGTSTLRSMFLFTRKILLSKS